MTLIELTWFTFWSFCGSLVALLFGYDIVGQWIGAALGFAAALGAYFFYLHWRESNGP